MADAPSPVQALVAESRLALPDEVPPLVEAQARRLGARGARLHLADLDQRWLVPVGAEGQAGEPLSVDGTPAGASFRSMQVVQATGDEGVDLWVPVVDSTDRLGVMRFAFDDAPDEAGIGQLTAFCGVVAELVLAKSAYGDHFEITRRRRPLSTAAELMWQLLPPLTFATRRVAVSAAFVPTDDLGGDAFDYGVDARRAQVAIFDALGHSLSAGLLATTAVAAYRNGRRSRLELPELASHVGSAIERHSGEGQFVTGVLTSLDLASGLFSWCVAGHLPPLLLRSGRVVKHLEGDTGTPFGVGPASRVHQEQLEPGDRLVLYTDGVIEARTADGEFFGLDRLVDLITRTSEDLPPEMMRRLMHAISDYADGAMGDDATALMVEWRGAGTERLAEAVS